MSLKVQPRTYLTKINIKIKMSLKMITTYVTTNYMTRHSIYAKGIKRSFIIINHVLIV